ncbi:hypothetical protein P43SY_011017 [Pythium insidiosum]|uniref:Uncharacterized protein n=1 Tax=Pythium insidiosum TaxID=114742 RepID=A0AAD5Q1D3_PYTIN|nr:hypothetical protein P43SY_011017 [Pythium insidiosum]
MMRYETYPYAAARSSDSILRQTMHPYVTTNAYCRNTEVAVPPVSVSYRFYHNEWQKRMLPTGERPLEAYVVPGFEGLPELPSGNTTTGMLDELIRNGLKESLEPLFKKTVITSQQALEFEELFIRNFFVYADAVASEAQQVGNATMVALMNAIRDDSVEFFLVNSLNASSAASDPTRHLQQFVTDYFATLNGWATHLQINASHVRVEYALFNITDRINFTSVTITMPQPQAPLDLDQTPIGTYSL